MAAITIINTSSLHSSRDIMSQQQPEKASFRPYKKSTSAARDLLVLKKSPFEAEYSIRVSPPIARPATPSAEDQRITATALPPKTPGSRRKEARHSMSASMVPSDGLNVSMSVVMQCLSRAVWYQIRDNEFNFGTHIDVFCEDSHSFIPSMKTIENFFTCIFNTKSLSIECAVTIMAYVDKLRKISAIKLNRVNWKRICFIAILEADKVLRDKLVWNEDYKDLIPGIDLNLMKKLERAFLKNIEFSLTLTQSDYVIYLLELLSLRQKEQSTPEKTPRARTGSLRGESRRLERDELNRSM